MLAVPDWETDVPKTNFDFGKKVKKKNVKKSKKKDVPDNKKINSDKNLQNREKVIDFKAGVDNTKQGQVKLSNQKSIGKNIPQTNSPSTKSKKRSKKLKKQMNSNVVQNKKQKLNSDIQNKSPSQKSSSLNNEDLNKPDEILINEKKKVLNDEFNNEDVVDILFSENKNKKKNKQKLKGVTKPATQEKVLDGKKQKLKLMLEQSRTRNTITSSGQQLRLRMMEKLKSAQFRYLNEKLYTSDGSAAQELFRNDPTAFNTYHDGYQQQVKKWPVKPLDVIVNRISKMPKTSTIADMGCGEATLSERVQQKVRSFDLVSTNSRVESCDMAHTPLLSASVDVVVYCLALMGTNLTQYLLEASRVLKSGGILLIAEVESRFDNVDAFIKDIQKLGFKLTKLDKSYTVFFFLEFKKDKDPPSKKSKLPTLTLKPCLYKRR